MAMAKSVLEPCAKYAQANAEWGRIPRVGKTLEGLYRSQIFALVRRGEVKSAAVKMPGALRAGMRIIHLPSLRQWIERHVDTDPDAAK